MQQGQTGPIFGGRDQGALEVRRFEAGVPVDPTLPPAGQDQALNKGGLPAATLAGVPYGKTQILLLVRAQEVIARLTIQFLRHRDAVGDPAHWESQRRQT
jgi:hypothetical protein